MKNLQHPPFYSIKPAYEVQVSNLRKYRQSDNVCIPCVIDLILFRGPSTNFMSDSQAHPLTNEFLWTSIMPMYPLSRQ